MTDKARFVKLVYPYMLSDIEVSITFETYLISFRLVGP